MPTAPFRRQAVAQAAQANGGVVATPRPSGEVGNSLETDMLDLLQAKHAFAANLAVFKASDKMTGSLLNLRA